MTIRLNLLLVLSASSLLAQECTETPLWIDVMTAKNRADLLEFWDFQKVESESSVALPYVIPQPFSNIGAFSNRTYAPKSPYRFNH